MLSLLPQARPIASNWVDALLTMGQPLARPSDNARAALLAQLPEPLSEQELNVLRLLHAGLSNREIADNLFISPGTAKWHVHNILQKLGVGNRARPSSAPASWGWLTGNEGTSQAAACIMVTG